MKKGIFVVGLVLILFIAMANYFHLNQLEKEVTRLKGLSEQPSEPAEQEDIELGDVMTKLQRHSNKLWFAGKETNWPLAAFYIHELEETFEILTEGAIIDEGVDISMLASSMGLGPLTQVEQAIKDENPGDFLIAFENLTANCNSCHKSSNHPFVVIKTPTTPAFDNQEYKVVN